MTVFVDELRVYTDRPPFNVGSCHLTADSLDELHAFATKLGLRRNWFQARSTVPHYDLLPSKRTLALKLGAKFVPAREQAIQRIAARRHRST